MREFDFTAAYSSLLTAENVALVGQIHEYRGRHEVLAARYAEELYELTETAKLRTVESSNAIDGITTAADRLKKLVRNKTQPGTPDEQRLAGYRDALRQIRKNHDYIQPRPTDIIQLYKDLNKYAFLTTGDGYRQTDDHGGAEQYISAEPIPAREIPAAVAELCEAFGRAADDAMLDTLLLIPVFVVDFLCIWPFGKDSGAMSRLLSTLLLYRAGYDICRYVSLDRMIAGSSAGYFAALRESSHGWSEGANDYAPFARYLLGTVLAAQKELDGCIEMIADRTLSKPERVGEIIRNHSGRITKSEIMAQCPDVSQITVQRALAELLKSGGIVKIGNGRYTSYTWNGEK